MSKLSKLIKNNKAESKTKLWNYQIKMKRAFTTLNTIIEDMENEDSELTKYDDDEEEKSHL